MGQPFVDEALRRVKSKLHAGLGVLAGEHVTGYLGRNLGWQVRVVLECDAFLQLEGDGQTVGRKVPGLGQIALNGSGEPLPCVKAQERVVGGQELRPLEAVTIVRVVAGKDVGSAISEDATGYGVTPLRFVSNALYVLLSESGRSLPLRARERR